MTSNRLDLPFVQLVEDARAEGRRRSAAAGRPRTVAMVATPVDLRLALLEAPSSVRSRRRLTMPMALVSHALAAGAIVVLPLVTSDDIPAPTSAVRAFLVEPAMLAPAPPPPPPPPAASVAPARVAPKPAPVEPAAFTAPIEMPSQLEPEESFDLGIEGGVPGGVEGGVPGGVVGGVIGGLPVAAPAAEHEPVRVGGHIKAPKKVRHVAPVYPEVAKDAHVEGIVIIEATIDESGRVIHAQVLRGVPLLDEVALDAVRQWVYVPTLLNGTPKAVVLTVTVNFELRRSMA